MAFEHSKRRVPVAAVSALLAFAALTLRAQDLVIPSGEDPQAYSVEHAECVFFGAKHDQFVKGSPAAGQGNSLNTLTDQVVKQLGTVQQEDAALNAIPGGSRTNAYRHVATQATIDKFVFAAIQAAGVQPALKTNDFEFIRRATLDLTGRIPTPDRVLQFTSDTSPSKRATLIDELLNKPEWVDKWTMYLGDHLNNTTVNSATGVVRYANGRDAFYTWIKQQLTNNTPYNQVAASLISAKGTNTYTQGELNWIVNGLVTNGPIQDAYDQEAANVAETFLGISHMNCTLCHNGRGHLDSLSLWGMNEARVTSWGLAAFMAKTNMSRTPVAGAVNNMPYYWAVQDAGKSDYQLNTVTGNRPARCLNNLLPITNAKGQTVCAATGAITPAYPFTGETPNAGEDYRDALARMVTSDAQFSRATVNFIWAQFFGRGIVDPPNQFDVSRLDPDNPPPAPWTLQPSNPRLLNALAQDFVSSGYDLKALMREIVNSDTYQLSASYNGPSPDDGLFARKQVRRLWGEEIHDAVVQSSNIVPVYNIGNLGKVSFAMQFPEPRNMPGGTTTAFLDAFLRGNRDDEERKPDSNLSQALGLMNDPIVVSRVKAVTSNGAPSLLAKSLPMTDDQLVMNLYLNVLSRLPSDTEKQTALATLSGAGSAAIRQQKAENILWSLYNKVDFIFNY